MCKKGGFVCGLFMGAIVGSAVGFLCAPESGEEIRKKLKESAEDTLDNVTHRLDAYGIDVKKYVEGVSTGLTDRVKEYKDELENRIQDIQNEVDADIAELNLELEQLHSEEQKQASVTTEPATVNNADA